MKLLHIHAQPHWHAEAYIVGNSEGLKALRDAIDKALENGHAATPHDEKPVFVTDGEGYVVHVVKNDDKWDGESWNKAALPYTDEIAQYGYEGKIGPWDMVPEEYWEALRESYNK